MSSIVYYDKITLPSWSLYLAATKKGLCFVGSSPANKQELKQWVASHYSHAELVRDEKVLEPYVKQMREYFLGDRSQFDFPTDLVGTDFQKAVWEEIYTIPYGQTLTYGEIAAALGKPPSASRAVGTAVGKNPIMIVCPCHRVMPKNGEAKGFRGGLRMKEQLIGLEKEVTHSS